MSAPPSVAADAGLPIVLLPAALSHPDFIADSQRSACARTAAFGRLARHPTLRGEWWSDQAVAPELGHEHWLRTFAGLTDDEAVAACAAAIDDIDAAWRLDPVHLHVGRDHLVLTDPAALAMTMEEATALASSVVPLFAAEGLSLVTPRPDRWYLLEDRTAQPLRVRTGSLLAAIGRSIDAYLPAGEDARRCRRLLNEVQMTWHDHPVNRTREARGSPAINSVWIEGRCPRRTAHVAALGRLATVRGSELRAVASADAPVRADRTDAPPSTAAPGAPLLLAGQLLSAQIDGDPQRWIEGWNELDRSLFAEIATMAGRFGSGARLVLCGDAGWRELLVQPSDRWRLWRRTDPIALLSIPDDRDPVAFRQRAS